MKPMLTLVLFFAALFAVVLGMTAHRFVLVAKGDVAVASYPEPGPVPIATLRMGDRATVLSCDDMKSYQAVHVRLENGAEGYVIEGSYELVPGSLWNRSSGGPVIFFMCPTF